MDTQEAGGNQTLSLLSAKEFQKVGQQTSHLQSKKGAKFERLVVGVKRPVVSQGCIQFILLCLAIRRQAYRIKAAAGEPETRPGTKLWLGRPSSKISPTHRVFGHHGNSKVVLHNLKGSPPAAFFPSLGINLLSPGACPGQAQVLHRQS